MKHVMILLLSFLAVIAMNLAYNIIYEIILRVILYRLNKEFLDENDTISTKDEWKKASKIFGVGVKVLKKMEKSEVKKMFRKMAMKMHPDHGGNEKDFRNLRSAYEFVYAA